MSAYNAATEQADGERHAYTESGDQYIAAEASL